MEYVNIMEAARRCAVSDKTIRRAIHKGTLPARFPKPNRCEIAVSDLEHFLPGQVQRFTPRQASGQVQAEVESRIAALERRVQVLEQQVQGRLRRPEASKPGRPSHRAERTTGPLPRNLVSLPAFAQTHSVAEHKALAAIEMGLLPVKCGEWTDQHGTLVTRALDPKGRQAFYQIYQGVPPFVPCEQCPHEGTSTPV